MPKETETAEYFQKYNAGLNMIAIILCKGPFMVAIWLQSQIQSGPFMIAICFNKDQIWLKFQKFSLCHVTLIFERISPKQIFDDCIHIWSKSERIAITFAPYRNFDCYYIISSWLYKLLDSYMVQVQPFNPVPWGMLLNSCVGFWTILSKGVFFGISDP